MKPKAVLLQVSMVLVAAPAALASGGDWKKVEIVEDEALVAECEWIATVENDESSDHSLKSASKALRKSAAKAGADTVLIASLTTGKVGGVGGGSKGWDGFKASKIQVLGDAYRCADTS